MNIKHDTLTVNIHLLTFKTQLELASTFLRFQEHYESPYFRGKFFSLEEFKDWYTRTSPKGIKTGKFTYYSDWAGFNIPSNTLQPFYEGRFDPLSDQEQQLLDLFSAERGAFYIIGIHSETKYTEQLLQHEIAHALFYTNDDYRAEVLQIISKYDTEDIREELRIGYHEESLTDEVHAYSIDSERNLESHIPAKMSTELRKVFRKYLESS